MIKTFKQKLAFIKEYNDFLNQKTLFLQDKENLLNTKEKDLINLKTELDNTQEAVKDEKNRILDGWAQIHQERIK